MGLDFMFHPRSIAVVGASADPAKRGYGYVDALLYHGFKGPVYPVNPRGETVQGLQGYTSLLDIPGDVDYVISSVPNSVVLRLMDEAARKKVRCIHFFTARFSETGHEEDAALERELLSRAREYGIRVLGPNCMGIYHAAEGISFTRFQREPGEVGLISQSGGNVNEIVYPTALRGVRFSKAVSFGNGFDITESELLEYLAEDPETRIIGAYLEGVRDGPRFVEALKRAAARKPVVLLKGGNTEAGTRAVASHTASLAGSRQVWEAVARQANAVLVDSLEELQDMLVAFQFCKPARGWRVAVVGGGGGRSVESADACERAGLRLPLIPDAVRQDFKTYSPRFWDWVSNPVDGSILHGTGLDIKTVLRLLAASDDFDLFITNTLEMWNADVESDLQRVIDNFDGFVEGARAITDKPVAIVTSDQAPEHEWQYRALVRNRRKAVEAGLATFPSIRRAALALSRLSAYHAGRSEG